MFDLQAAGYLEEDLDVIELARSAQDRYYELWDELTHDEVVPRGENYKIHQRIRRLNELGFDVAELTVKTEPAGLRLQARHPGRRGRAPPAPAVRADRAAGAGEPGPRAAR